MDHEPNSEPKLRPNERRERTDIVFREMKDAEAAQRRAKTERLRVARLQGKAKSKADH